MRIGVLRTHGLATVLAGLACVAYVSGQETNVLTPELLKAVRARAEQGDPEAQVGLGAAYYVGNGVAQDYAEAVRWFRKAAEQGEVSVESTLGFMYERGQGVAQDYAEAVRWFRKAAEQGDPDAQFNLGYMYYWSRGVPKEYVQAHMWLNLASSRASGDAQKNSAAAREILAGMMTPAQISEAQRRARDWKPKTWDELKRQDKK